MPRSRSRCGGYTTTAPAPSWSTAPPPAPASGSAAAHGLQANTASDALEAHYREFPDERPTTAEIAHAEAQIVGHPASGRPDLIELAVEALGHDAYVKEILAWASGSLDAERRLTGAGHTP